MNQPRRSAGFLALLLALAACEQKPPEPPPPPPPPPIMTYPAPIGPELGPVHQYHVGALDRGDSLGSALGRLKVSGAEVTEVVQALEGVFDFPRRAQPGHFYEIKKDAEGRLSWFRYTVSETEVFVAFRDSEGVMRGVQEFIPIVVKTATISGRVEASLYVSMTALGEGPQLPLMFVDLFAWDVDFFTETQPGDRFWVAVEKRYVNDRFVGYGRVLGAEYQIGEARVHRAFRYEFEDGKVGYYTPDGTSVQKAFLKSPIKFASITSRYGMRRHPILRYVRAHRGVDYGAPRGTAIWSVADGVVRRAGRGGGYGKVVYIQHANGIQTRYAHLNGYGKGIRRGARVRQKQVIGYVGKTGLATGPHLHFEVLRNGRHLNPLRLVVPPAPPIPEDQKTRFLGYIEPTVKLLTQLR